MQGSAMMDIDELYPSPSLKRAPTTDISPTMKRIKLDLPVEQLAELNREMNDAADDLGWGKILTDSKTDGAESADPSRFNRQWLAIMENLISALWATDLRGHIIKMPNLDERRKILSEFTPNEMREWQDGVVQGLKTKNWEDLINHPKIQIGGGQTVDSTMNLTKEKREQTVQLLSQAYSARYVGDAVETFKNHLLELRTENLYAKTISIVQSSGTGKSRLLSELGKHVFTLPICLCGKEEVAYPIGDLGVLDYLQDTPQKNDLSLSAHHRIASFIAAAHETMLQELQGLKARSSLNSGELLRQSWHYLMEEEKSRTFRIDFFQKVLRTAKEINEGVHKPQVRSPQRKEALKDFSALSIAEAAYSRTRAKEAVANLMKFILKEIPGRDSMCITYIDEAHYLQESIWILTRLLSCQPSSERMWYVFMGTKAKISYYSPDPPAQVSVRLRDGYSKLPLPYLSLGFDQHAIKGDRSCPPCIGPLQTIEYLCNYGRPLWKALYQSGQASAVIETACFKLTCGQSFDGENPEHVFAVLSQRLCLDPILANSEALVLAEQSVANHMRLLTAISPENVFTTNSPSEPILALGAAELLHRDPSNWPAVLKTLSKELCSRGIIEKGLLGELAARTVLLIARDFASLKLSSTDIPDLLQPVPLLDFIDTAFNIKQSDEDTEQFRKAFDKAYVNFTHWAVTKDSMPYLPTVDVLANMWARGFALQCCFLQESLDLIIPIYFGSIEKEAEFIPALFSAIIVQVKYRTAADPAAEDATRPFGVPRDSFAPLPYIALLLELGSTASHRGAGKIRVTSHSTPGVSFVTLVKKYSTALEILEEYEKKEAATKKESKRLKDLVADWRNKMDFYQRYSISVRGTSPDEYPILKQAGIEKSFASLLSTTLPQAPSPRSPMDAQMRAIDRFGPTSAHAAWMFIVPDDKWEHRAKAGMAVH